MNIEEVRDYCLSKKGTTEDFPFDDVTLVIKVGGKMFALISLDAEEKNVALKCDPEYAIELREKYEAVRPAWHFNKKHWNNVFLNSSLSEKNIKEWIDHSYEMVLKGMSKKMREAILSEL
jgi:predicted DNA-binding protein (MmcQ/YjbR family)